MSKRLIDYLPPVLQDIREYRMITEGAEQPLFDQLWQHTAALLEDQYVMTASEAGLTHIEALLGIKSLPQSDISERRQRLLARLKDSGAYTAAWLALWLAARVGGEGRSRFSVSGFKLYVSLPVSSDYEGILSELREYIPANMEISPTTVLSGGSQSEYVGVALRISQKVKLKSEECDVVAEYSLKDESGEALTDEAERLLLKEV